MPRAPCCSNAALNPARRRIHTSSSSKPLRPRSSIQPTFFTAKQLRFRTFTHRSTLLLVSRHIPRPQLPFLHPASHHRPSPTASAALIRYLTTERKARWKAKLLWQLRFHAYAWPCIALAFVIWLGVEQAKWELQFPTPREWTFRSRWNLRTGQFYLYGEDAKIARILTNWGTAGLYYKRLLERLENKELDGTNLIEGETLVEGVGRTGFDISMKSEPWRRGYYQALMGAGSIAEHLDGMGKLKGVENTRFIPWESIPGPSNPRPKPLPWDRDGVYLNPPTEMECEDVFPQPEKFYMKILTTKGFNNGQRLDAALAYADWCDFKGLRETAGNMYDWALDIAASGLPQGADGVVDIRTGVIEKGKDELVSQNLLKATTALAVHHARGGEVKEALPIFLSILRARKALPAAPAFFEAEKSREEAPADSNSSRLLSALKSFIIDTPYPAAPPSGDDRPYNSLKEACQEVGLMTYIGEILFATSQSEKEKGLSWTRDSVEAAEAIMWVMDETKDQDGREKCRECLETGLGNWKDMAKQMEKLSLKQKQDAEKSSGFLSTGIGKESMISKAQEAVERWKQEQDQIELRVEKTLPLVKPLKATRSGWMTV